MPSRFNVQMMYNTNSCCPGGGGQATGEETMTEIFLKAGQAVTSLNSDL